MGAPCVGEKRRQTKSQIYAFAVPNGYSLDELWKIPGNSNPIHVPQVQAGSRNHSHKYHWAA